MTLPSLAPEAALRSAAATAVLCFSVQARPEPGVMPRVLEVFAKRNLVPLRWHSDLAHDPAGRALSIDIQVEGLTLELGGYIARCLRQLHDVDTVLMSEKSLA